MGILLQHGVTFATSAKFSLHLLYGCGQSGDEVIILHHFTGSAMEAQSQITWKEALSLSRQGGLITK